MRFDNTKIRVETVNDLLESVIERDRVEFKTEKMKIDILGPRMDWRNTESR